MAGATGSPTPVPIRSNPVRRCSSPPSASRSSSASSSRRAGCSCRGRSGGGCSCSAASFVFYGAWDWRYAFLLAASIVANQIVAVGDPAPDRATTGAAAAGRSAAVAANLAAARVVQVRRVLRRVRRRAPRLASASTGQPPIPDVVLPIGISFFTFQALSLRHRRRAAGSIHPAGLLDFAVYLSFFPHLVAGPIVRASEFLPQLRSPPRPPPGRRRRSALWLIAGGLVKKVVVATYLADRDRRPAVRLPGPSTAGSRRCSASTPTPSRSTPTSPATPTWRSAWRCCWASGSRRTSTPRTPRARSRTSGGGGT